jgi:hypothetical protein
LRRPFFPAGFMGLSMTGSRTLTDPPSAASEARRNLRSMGRSTVEGHRARRLLANLGLS